MLPQMQFAIPLTFGLDFKKKIRPSVCWILSLVSQPHQTQWQTSRMILIAPK